MTNDAAKRLGEYVRARRRALKLTQLDVQKAGGPSTATLRLIEGGRHTDFRPATASPLEQVLQWQPGSINAILEGDEPREIVQPMPPTPSVLDMATAVWACLRELAESPADDPYRASKADHALISTADLLIDMLLALNAGPAAKPLIQEMSNVAYELLQLDKEKDHAVPNSETSEPDAPDETRSPEEVSAVDGYRNDDPLTEREFLPPPADEGQNDQDAS